MSVKIVEDQPSVIYPPMFGMEGGPCSESCSCIPCNQMRHDAAVKCPLCGVEIGYGGLVPVEWKEDIYRDFEYVGEILLYHLDCYKAKYEADPHETIAAVNDLKPNFEEVEGAIGGHDAADD